MSLSQLNYFSQKREPSSSPPPSQAAPRVGQRKAARLAELERVDYRERESINDENSSEASAVDSEFSTISAKSYGHGTFTVETAEFLASLPYMNPTVSVEKVKQTHLLSSDTA